MDGGTVEYGEFVTGTSRGLGRACPWLQRRRLDRERLRHRSLAGKPGPDHLALTCDVTQPVEVAAFATRVLVRIGPPALLLNNTAVINRNDLLWEASPERGILARHRRESQGRAWDDPGPCCLP